MARKTFLGGEVVTLHDLAQLPVVEAHERCLVGASLGEVRLEVEVEPRPDRHRELLHDRGPRRAAPEVGQDLGVAREDVEHLVFREAVLGCAQVAEGVADEHASVVRLRGEPGEQVVPDRAPDGRVQPGHAVVRPPAAGLLEGELEVEGKPALLVLRALADARRGEAVQHVVLLIRLQPPSRLLEPEPEQLLTLLAPHRCELLEAVRGQLRLEGLQAVGRRGGGRDDDAHVLGELPGKPGEAPGAIGGGELIERVEEDDEWALSRRPRELPGELGGELPVVGGDVLLVLRPGLLPLLAARGREPVVRVAPCDLATEAEEE